MPIPLIRGICLTWWRRSVIVGLFVFYRLHRLYLTDILDVTK